MIAVAVCRFLTGLILVVVALPSLAAPPRIRYTINDGWRYAAGPVDGAEAADFRDDAWQRVHLPHTWNLHDALDKSVRYRRGLGWYRRTLVLDPSMAGKRIFLYFEGANQIADVYVNGHHAGRHIGGYTAFAFDVTNFVSLHVPSFITVRVDNSHDPDVPPLNADFTFYGGIYRDVWLIATSPIHIPVTDYASPGVFISTPEVSDDYGVVRVAGTVVNHTTRRARVRVTNRILDPAGNEVAATSSNLSLPSDSARSFEHRTGRIAAPRLWSPARPHLYRVRTEVYRNDVLVDVVENPLGFRWFSADAGRGFTLNGRPLRLNGTNRHQDHAGFGNAMPDSLHRRDVGLIKENGFNFLRLAHYPQDPAVLDESDRLGLVVWEEIPVVNLISTSTAFAENSERMLIEMIRQHHNHPSIVFWGYMNEVLLTKPDPVPERYYEIVPQLAKRLDDRARAEDPTRLTVTALSRDEIDQDYGIGDIPHVLGLNLYFGWYYETFASLGPYLDRIHRDRPSRPLIVSEYGADTDERVHTREPRAFDFSSEHGQNFHTESWPQLEARPYLTGTAVWNQFDFGSAGRQDTKYGLNQKGLFFYDRTPKDTTFYYQAALLDHPVLHLAREWTERAGSTPADRTQPVWVYSNQTEVELIANGKSVGTKPVENRIARWDVELAGGANTIRARSGALEDRITIMYEDRTGGTFIAVNAGAHYAHIDAAHVYWEPDRPWVAGSWGYVGGDAWRTHHRVFGTDEDPLYQSARIAPERYQFDVPDGTYEVTLGFNTAEERHFSVSVNGHIVPDIALTSVHTATNRSVHVEARAGSGIRIEFTSAAGKPSVAAVTVRRLP